MPDNDRRLIEDLIPIHKISAEASREKSLRHGNISISESCNRNVKPHYTEWYRLVQCIV